MTIFEIVTTALNTLTPVPFALDTFLTATGADLPDTFITYLDVSDVAAQHADDQETERTYRIQVSIFSRSGLVSLPDVDGAMLAAGFQKGPARQLPYNAETRHFGIAKDFIYL